MSEFTDLELLDVGQFLSPTNNVLYLKEEFEVAAIADRIKLLAMEGNRKKTLILDLARIEHADGSAIRNALIHPLHADQTTLFINASHPIAEDLGEKLRLHKKRAYIHVPQTGTVEAIGELPAFGFELFAAAQGAPQSVAGLGDIKRTWLAKKVWNWIKHGEESLMQGHFSLPSGLHYEQFINLKPVIAEPWKRREIAYEIARLNCQRRINRVVSGSHTGFFLALEVARFLKVPSAYLGRLGPTYMGDSTLEWQRHYVQPGERCLVVSDVLGVGNMVRSTCTAVNGRSADVAAITSVVDTSDGSVVFVPGLPSDILLKVDKKVSYWRASACKLCKDGIPLDNLFGDDSL